jgi:cell division topological specificity factor
MGFFNRDKSASAAKERLQLVLIHDRSDLPPGVMEELRDGIINVLSRYIKVDKSNVRIEIAQSGREQRLIADIPLETPPRRSR